MGAGEYDMCRGDNSTSKQLELLPMLVLFPCHVCFALFFLFQLWRHNHIKIGVDSNTTIDVPFATVVFILTSLLATSLAFGNEIIEPIRQMHYAPVMPLCQVSRFFSWVIGGFVYGTQLEVFVVRLENVFQRWESLVVSKSKIRAFNVAFVISAAFGACLFALRSVFMDCWVEQKYGVLGRTSAFPKRALFCNVQPRFRWLRTLASLQLFATFSVCGVLLLSMFITRMRKVRDRSCNGSNNHGFDRIIEKATMLTVIGFIFTALALILTGLTGFVTLVYLDYLVQNVLMYAMYGGFGDRLYDLLFAHVVRVSTTVRRSMIVQPNNPATPTNSETDDD